MVATYRRYRMLCPRIICFVSCVLLCCQPSLSQVNPIFRGNGIDQDPSRNKFSLTSNSDCSNEVKNIYDSEASVVGFVTQNLNTGPTDCTIRLKSEDGFQDVTLLVKLISANVLDCQTTLEIYDGFDGNVLDSFDCYGDPPQNRRQYPTSGDTVTFRFKRPNPSSYNFDIDFRIVRLRGSINPDNTGGWGDDFFFDKFPQEAIVGMIGGFYGLILIICIGIIIYFNFKFQGRLKRWETYQLSTMKTDNSAFDAKSHATEPSRVYATEMTNYSRGPSSYYSRSHTDPYSRKPQDDSFQQNLMSNKRDQNRYRDRMASENSTYANTDDDDPDHFVEKVITPSVRTRPRRRQEHRPPSFADAISERSSRHSDETESDETDSSYDSTAKKRITSSEEESSEYSHTESETETESDDDSRRGARARRRNNDKKGRQRKDNRRRPPSTDGETSSYRSGPRNKRPAAGQAGPIPAMGAPYAAYPPGQFVPVMAGPPPAFQPVHMVPNQAHPQYLDEPRTAPGQQQIRPTDPPVYSYLVRRGYTPMDPNNGRNSPASNGSSRRGPEEEPEVPLQTGVEYMRR